MIHTFSHPRSCAISADLSLCVDGVPVQVLHTAAADFANFVYDPCDGPVEVFVKRRRGIIGAFEIRPLAKGIKGKAEAEVLSFTIDKPEKLSVEIEGMRKSSSKRAVASGRSASIRARTGSRVMGAAYR